MFSAWSDFSSSLGWVGKSIIESLFCTCLYAAVSYRGCREIPSKCRGMPLFDRDGKSRF